MCYRWMGTESESVSCLASQPAISILHLAICEQDKMMPVSY